MSTFLVIAVSVSVAVLLLATLMERSAVLARINGANGMIILVALILSFLASLLVAVVEGVLRGWGALFLVLLCSPVYHVAMAALLIGYLQWLATRTAAQFKAMEAARAAAWALKDSVRRLGGGR